MKTLNLKTLVLLVISMAIMMVSCEPKKKKEKDGPREKGGLSETEKLIKRHIDDLAVVTNWADAQNKYAKNQYDINDKISRANLKKEYQGLNEKAYCHSIDTIMYIIMTGDCESRHKELYALNTERAKYSEVKSTLHDQVIQAFTNHERLIKIIKGWGGRQNVESFKDTYNSSYDSNVQTVANNELAKAPSCSYIQKNLKAPFLKGRHEHFCEDIITVLEQTSTDPNDANIVVNRIKFYKDKYGEDKNYKEWRQRLNRFQEEHNNN